jgi:crotonobetainyl-CoA:carnitine CoA-transferase CaiB-like acyl-CoA transferase
MRLDEVLARFADVDCCLSPVLDLAEALGSQQVTERGLVRPAGGALQALFPAKFDGEAARPRLPLLDITPSEKPGIRRKQVAL